MDGSASANRAAAEPQRGGPCDLAEPGPLAALLEVTEIELSLVLGKQPLNDESDERGHFLGRAFHACTDPWFRPLVSRLRSASEVRIEVTPAEVGR